MAPCLVFPVTSLGEERSRWEAQGAPHYRRMRITWQIPQRQQQADLQNYRPLFTRTRWLSQRKTIRDSCRKIPVVKGFVVVAAVVFKQKVNSYKHPQPYFKTKMYVVYLSTVLYRTGHTLSVTSHALSFKSIRDIIYLLTRCCCCRSGSLRGPWTLTFAQFFMPGVGCRSMFNKC